MACSRDFADFVCRQLEGIGEVTSKKMFGEYLVYVDGKPVIMACDDIAFVKIMSAIEPLMQDAEKGFPYDGAKEHYVLDLSDKTRVQHIVKTLWNALPFPKPKKKKQ